MVMAWTVHAENGRQYISVPELQEWIRQGKDLELIDVRGKQQYQSGTIAGAVNAGNDPKGYLPAVHSDPIILITTDDINSNQLDRWVMRLQNVKDQIWILSGGINAWIAQGEPLEKPDEYYTRPGSVPFIIPKGLCEQGEPAQVYD